MNNRIQTFRTGENRLGFTLTELLVVISIIGVITSALAFVVAGAQTRARELRTRSQLQRIESILQREIQELLEARIPVRMPPTGDFQAALGAHGMLANGTMPPGVIREGTLSRTRRFWNEARRVDLMYRFPYHRELVFPINPPSVGRPLLMNGMPQVYFRRNNGAENFQSFHSVPTDLREIRRLTDGYLGNSNAKTDSAELLYAILSRIWVDGEPAISLIRDSEIADTDGDRFPEIVDVWGDPIYFRLEIQVPVVRTSPAPQIEGMFNIPLDQYSTWMTQFEYNGQTFRPISYAPNEFSPERVRIRLYSKNLDPGFDPDNAFENNITTF